MVKIICILCVTSRVFILMVPSTIQMDPSLDQFRLKKFIYVGKKNSKDSPDIHRIFGEYPMKLFQYPVN